MFPIRYWCARFFNAEFWAKLGAAITVTKPLLVIHAEFDNPIVVSSEFSLIKVQAQFGVIVVPASL